MSRESAPRIHGECSAARPVTIATINLGPQGTGSAEVNVTQFINAIERLVPRKTDVILLPEGITIIGTGKTYVDVADGRKLRYGQGMSMQSNEAASAEPYSLRKASSNDVDAVARIWHLGWIDGHVGHVPPELVPHRNQEQFISRARDRLESMWVAESHDQIVGFVVVKGNEVEQIYVDRTARGTGVAAMLLHKAETEIRRAGHRGAWLAVVAGNQRARSFYSRMGWRDSGPISYLAETETGPLAVPSHRYKIDLTDR